MIWLFYSTNDFSGREASHVFAEEIWDMKRNNSFPEAEVFSQAAEILWSRKKTKLENGKEIKIAPLCL